MTIPHIPVAIAHIWQRKSWVARSLPRLLPPFVAVILLVYGIGQWAERHEQDLMLVELRQSAEMNLLGLRGLVSRHDYLPFAAASYPDVSALLRSPGDKRLTNSVNHHLADLRSASGAAALFLIDAHGMTLASSNWAEAGSFVGQSYWQRPYFQDAVQGHRGFFYGLGLTTGVPGLFIAEPVINGASVIGVLAVKVSLSSIADSWAKGIDPVVLQDSRGIVFLSSEPQWMYRSQAPLTPDDMIWLRQHSQYGTSGALALLPWQIRPGKDPATFTFTSNTGSREYERLALASRLPEFGWNLIVTRNAAEIRRAGREAQTIAALFAALVIMGALYRRLQAHRRQEQEAVALEREQRESEQQMQRAARLASVGEMASTLAHELNQPLMALSNFAVATRSLVGKAPQEMIIASLDDIVEQAKRANEIVRRVRSFINPKRGHYGTTDLRTVIDRTTAMLRSELQRNAVALQMQVDPALPLARGDSVLLEQAVVNLVQNAIHAQTGQPESTRRILMVAGSQATTVSITVQDNGPGIPEAERSQIFTPFFTTKSDGLGLGLNICRTIVEAHGGSITVHSGSGTHAGAVFTIHLPIEQ